MTNGCSARHVKAGTMLARLCFMTLKNMNTIQIRAPFSNEVFSSKYTQEKSL